MSAHEDFVDDTDSTGDAGQYSPRIRAEVLDEMEQSGWFSHRPPAELAHGACVGHPEPDIWFGGELEDEVAKSICGTCPVAALCLEWAERSGQQSGIWGGKRLGRTSRRGPAPRETCARGHKDWTVYSNGDRRCRTCKRERQAAAKKGKK